MLSHAFQFVDKVIFEIGATNLRSRRAIEKVGAKLILETELHGKPYTIYMIQKVNE